jgi:general secretion pathway protein A
VRLLANIETATEKLLPLILAGQPELAARLEESNLRQLKQRVALRCEIALFELPETAAYIASRIRTAGGEASRLFTREAVMLIHNHSGGIPRTISVMCDNALVNGFALGRQPVDREIILEVCRDFRLRATVAETKDEVPEERPVEPAERQIEASPVTPPADETPQEIFEPVARPRRALFGFGRR